MADIIDPKDAEAFLRAKWQYEKIDRLIAAERKRRANGEPPQMLMTKRALATFREIKEILKLAEKEKLRQIRWQYGQRDEDEEISDLKQENQRLENEIQRIELERDLEADIQKIKTDEKSKDSIRKMAKSAMDRRL